MLAASHAIGRNAVIDEEVAIFLADILLARYPALLAARYKVDLAGMDAAGVVEAVARKSAAASSRGVAANWIWKRPR